MIWDEIEIPKELRPFMLEKAEVTSLGQKNGAVKQFRYGNLHIREYNDKYLVHMDKIDPRKDPLGHLIVDAPEVLVGLATAAITGADVSSKIFTYNKNSKLSKSTSALIGFFVAVISGYVGYSTFKKIKSY